MSVLFPEIEPYDHGMLDTGDGNRLYFECCGNPDGLPVVVLHGGPGSGCSAASRRYFDPSAYRIILFDQRNCGRSLPNAADPDAILPPTPPGIWSPISNASATISASGDGSCLATRGVRRSRLLTDSVTRNPLQA